MVERRSAVMKDGTVVVGDYFDDNDFEKIKDIFHEWQNVNGELKKLGGRNLNVPDVFSEALYCYFFGGIRTNGDAKAHSYDAVNMETGNGIQVKAASIANDLTSFGPKSKWDELWFVDLAPNGTVDGQVDIYKINEDVKSLIMNKAKNETFADQQAQGRRPRFSIKKEIIEKNNLKPMIKVLLN